MKDPPCLYHIESVLPCIVVLDNRFPLTFNNVRSSTNHPKNSASNIFIMVCETRGKVVPIQSPLVLPTRDQKILAELQVHTDLGFITSMNHHFKPET